MKPQGVRFIPRTCRLCGKGKGTWAYRWIENGKRNRDYFHPKCFMQFLAKLKEVK
jgi:hypothetical protein